MPQDSSEPSLLHVAKLAGLAVTDERIEAVSRDFRALASALEQEASPVGAPLAAPDEATLRPAPHPERPAADPADWLLGAPDATAGWFRAKRPAAPPAEVSDHETGDAR